MASIHQVNHPGKELKISYRARNKHLQDYYFFQNSKNQGIRYWNRCAIGHKRKFIECEGRFVSDLNSSFELSGLLRFWGEYEGHSKFMLLPPLKDSAYWNSPYAVHQPFFCRENMNDQNTDPYIFGNNFYYAVCKKSELKNIKVNDIILFGSEFGKTGNVKFYLDTLFVIENEEDSITSNSFYDELYIESTLRNIGLNSTIKGKMPIHIGKKYQEKNSKIFSFFPAKLSKNISFGRPVIDTVKLGLQKPGARTGAKSRVLVEGENIESIWNYIANEVLNQGFLLGTHANQLITLNNLPCQ
jgi:hypothetical protein